MKWQMYPLLDSLGIERRGLHAVRHCNSTLMDRLGVPLKLRQQRPGSGLTLDVYTHVASEDDVLHSASNDIAFDQPHFSLFGCHEGRCRGRGDFSSR
jgi:hypothetical protein